jgi:FkbM family methyltransferase
MVKTILNLTPDPDYTEPVENRVYRFFIAAAPPPSRADTPQPYHAARSTGNMFKRKKIDDMFVTLQRARDRWDIRPEFVIDVGAAEGKWSGGCAEIWPDSKYILVEPLEEQRAALEKLTNRPNWEWKKGVAGAAVGTIDFAVTDDLDGSGVYQRDCFPKRKIDVIPLDSLLPLEGEGLLKLDTHGFEVPIFEGATRLLPQLQMLVVEVYGHKISDDCLCFDQLCLFLRERGFQTAGIVNVINRPSDESFWQADFFFLRQNHPIFSSNVWR